MTIYFYGDEVKRICDFLKADEKIILKWLEENQKTNKYIKFEAITSLGQDWVQVIYGRNLGSTEGVIFQVSYLGTKFQKPSQSEIKWERAIRRPDCLFPAFRVNNEHCGISICPDCYFQRDH